MEISITPLATILDIRHRVMYPGLSLEEMRLPDDDDGIHLGLYLDELLSSIPGKPVSVISIFKRGEELQFRKFATEIAEQGKGYGSILLTYVMDYAARNQYKAIWCNARLSATALYSRFGMRAFGDPWMQHEIEFIKMKKETA